MMVAAMLRSYLVVTISKTSPSGKKIWALSMPQLPKNNITGSVEFSGFDLNSGNHNSLPWLKVGSPLIEQAHALTVCINAIEVY